MFKRGFWYGVYIFIPSWALANGLLFLPSTSETDLVIFLLSLVELIGIAVLVGGLLFEFDFNSYHKKIVILGVAILLVGYWVVPLVIYKTLARKPPTSSRGDESPESLFESMVYK